jgi:hypothetical protein
VAGVRVSILRRAVLAFVVQHTDGIECNAIVHQFRTVDRDRLMRVLYNLRQDGEIHSIKQHGQPGNAIWKGGRDPVAPPPTTGLEAKRIQRARQEDEREPLTYFGQGLQPPRCPSVWAYARHFQQARA